MNYEELVKMWDDSRKNWQSYRDTLADAAGSIYFGLKKRLNVENDELFKILPITEENDETINRTSYTPIGSITLTDYEGWGNFGIYIRLEKGTKTWPKKAYKIVFFIRKIEDKFELKIAEDGEIMDLGGEIKTEQLDKIENELDKLFQRLLKDSLEIWKRTKL